MNYVQIYVFFYVKLHDTRERVHTTGKQVQDQRVHKNKRGDITQQDIKEIGFEVMTGARDMILNGFGKSLMEGKRRDR